jgi:calcineurin-like phosphoesterase family protein/2'-5' RNA ligase
MSLMGKLTKLFSPKTTHKPKGSQNHYLIEFRFIDRDLKKQMKDLEYTIHKKFGVGQKHFVPHVTLAGGFVTNKEKDLLVDFNKLCSQSPKMKFKIKGFSAFEDPKRVVFFDIEPSEELKQFRWDLSQRIRNYCSLKQFDFHAKDDFIFHSTVSINIPPKEFHKIKNYVDNVSIPHQEYYLTRVTLLKNDKIFQEYDFFQQQMLTRDEAKSPEFYRRTQSLLDAYLRREEPPTSVDIKKRENQWKNVFLISDLHFDHGNIIKYCNRTFKDTEEMNTTLLKHWNDDIKDIDKVYFLGDLRFGRNSHSIEYWYEKLNGDVVFIKGSHDNEMPKIQSYETYLLNYREKNFLLVHDPDKAPKEWTGWIIHGHHHNNQLEKYPFINGETKTINVSVELLDYHPLNIDQLFSLSFEKIKYMKDIKSEPIYFSAVSN